MLIKIVQGNRNKVHQSTACALRAYAASSSKARVELHKERHTVSRNPYTVRHYSKAVCRNHLNTRGAEVIHTMITYSKEYYYFTVSCMVLQLKLVNLVYCI